jgi:hypothetical protein
MADPNAHSAWDEWLSPMRAVAAEGARIGFVTCLECGAALMLDPAAPISVPRLHADWHAAQNDRSGAENG